MPDFQTTQEYVDLPFAVDILIERIDQISALYDLLAQRIDQISALYDVLAQRIAQLECRIENLTKSGVMQ